MPPEGMVDALHQIHRVLAPNGILIDVRPDKRGPDPRGTAPTLVVRDETQDHPAGAVEETDYWINLWTSSERAMQRVLMDGLFSREGEETFTFDTYCREPEQLLLVQDETYELVDGATMRNLRRLKSRNHAAWVVKTEPVMAARLRPA